MTDHKAIAAKIISNEALYKKLGEMSEEYKTSEFHREKANQIRYKLQEELGLNARDFDVMGYELTKMERKEAERIAAENKYERSEKPNE